MTEVPRYSVEVEDADRGWEVRIVDASGERVFVRPCVNESEARTLASTITQHLYWLSGTKFREYYRLPEPAPGRS